MSVKKEFHIQKRKFMGLSERRTDPCSSIQKIKDHHFNNVQWSGEVRGKSYQLLWGWPRSRIKLIRVNRAPFFQAPGLCQALY